MDSGRLESARVSASKASPMGDALDAAARYVDAASLGASRTTRCVAALCETQGVSARAMTSRPRRKVQV